MPSFGSLLAPASRALWVRGCAAVLLRGSVGVSEIRLYRVESASSVVWEEEGGGGEREVLIQACLGRTSSRIITSPCSGVRAIRAGNYSLWVGSEKALLTHFTVTGNDIPV